ncbi:hypothetical protein BO83DRAFT_412127 [Aspergillus eucalypticola CBS 122712]|uniref:Enoyl reductase (ER) domain-containing protein n=1 Tax=Aspergillus eucalypticola (strain CBS 122712 / IBT 29274) TaxID=1448314 RepID=A0A317US31_ASPEC|nr:uncharacterized protein BO83DRAFT_412127 [Aspergillus eucalypticola CBS 122712]PWY63252.1 hypothetical protein BO83DRAFT_412127 [Aspergillus eucalypticola CBS 122712]
MSSDTNLKDPTVLHKVVRVVHAWKRESSMLQMVTSFISKPPSIQTADARQHTVWLFDNTAYQVPAPTASRQASWHAEVVACAFRKNSRRDITKLVAMIADLIGLDGEIGTDKETRHRITERLQPFLFHTASAHLMTLETPLSNSTIQMQKIGPTDESGISSQTISANSKHITDGTRIRSYLRGWGNQVFMDTIFAGPEGWLVISDIDDTIKYTKTSETTGILRTTFVEDPKPIAGMPQLYAHIQNQLVPAWFYVSASPYNLYPFLHGFLGSYFSPGTMILRDSSWLDISELVKSFTVNTHEYKVDRGEKIHGWFPKRQVLCIGDSTQQDPEAYAELYKRHPHWIQAIWIRKVTDVPHLDEQNSPERFKNAFAGIPEHVWRVFEQPAESSSRQAQSPKQGLVYAQKLPPPPKDLISRSLLGYVNMRPAKPQSTTMDEQTFVPPTMRALYFSPASTAVTDHTPMDEPRTDSHVKFDTDFQTPIPSGNDYLVKVQAAAFSHDELRLSNILNPSKSIPQIPLHSFCGTVISTPEKDHWNPDGPKFKVDDAVFGLIKHTRDGAAADYVIVSEDELAYKPKNISAAEAATIPMPALTAWEALFKYAGLDTADVRQGRQQLRVLITNARNNEIATQALQLLRSHKLFPHSRPWICATCDAEDQEDYLRKEYDVDATIYAPLPLPQDYDLGSIFRKNRWKPVDVVLDCAGQEMFEQAHSPKVIKEHGAVLTAVDSTPAEARNPLDDDEPRKDGVLSRFILVSPNGEALSRISELVEADEVRGRVESIKDLVDGMDRSIPLKVTNDMVEE